MVQAKREPGRPLDERRVEYLRKYEISIYKPWRRFTQKFMNQLDACASDTERWILIKGINDGRAE